LASVTESPRPVDHDPAIDSILTQPTSNGRLTQINRQMYQSLRALDTELRREQQIAACERSPFDDALQAQANNQQSSAQQLPSDAALDASGAAKNGVVASGAVSSGVASGANRANSLHRTSLSPGATGGSGNGAVGPKVAPGSDNEIVLRRLRKAAEQETDPSLRARLWKEYTDYKQGAAAK